MIAVPVVHHYL